VNKISDYPPHFQNLKRGSIVSIGFSDAICSGVAGLKTDRLFTPVVGVSMSGKHYLKVSRHPYLNEHLVIM